jgi:DNA-binding NarL/FixJ family response regulator
MLAETNARIARRLGCQDTVKTHVKHILRKLGCTARQAVSRYFLAKDDPFEGKSPLSMRH